VGSTVVLATISPTAALLLPLVASLLAVCLVLHCRAGMMVVLDKITMWLTACWSWGLGIMNISIVVSEPQPTSSGRATRAEWLSSTHHAKCHDVENGLLSCLLEIFERFCHAGCHGSVRPCVRPMNESTHNTALHGGPQPPTDEKHAPPPFVTRLRRKAVRRGGGVARRSAGHRAQHMEEMPRLACALARRRVCSSSSRSSAERSQPAQVAAGGPRSFLTSVAAWLGLGLVLGVLLGLGVGVGVARSPPGAARPRRAASRPWRRPPRPRRPRPRRWPG
jgi:hypothetical protein